MDRNAAHGNVCAQVLAALGQGNVQRCRSGASIVKEHLVKVAHPVKQHCFRIIGFDLKKLRHHRRDSGISDVHMPDPYIWWPVYPFWVTNKSDFARLMLDKRGLVIPERQDFLVAPTASAIAFVCVGLLDPSESGQHPVFAQVIVLVIILGLVKCARR